MRPPLTASSTKNEVVQPLPLGLQSQQNHKSKDSRLETQQQQQQHQQHQQQQQLLTASNNNNIHIVRDYDPSEFRIVDLSTSPPVTPESAFDISPNQFIHHQTALRSNSNSHINSNSNFFVNHLDEKYVLFESFASDDSSSALNIESSTANHHHLPLSETEPLLTNIEATVSDRNRSIYLQKNSASLIFTKKDVSPNNGSHRHHHHHHQHNQQRVNGYADVQNIESQPFLTYQKHNHRHHNHQNYLEKSGGGRVQHHHRRSLPLNYSAAGTNNSSVIGAAGQRSLGNYSGQKQTANTTAANTRKQHAYSWYAPVYSALEEELEQESRDSSPIHNLANAKKTTSHQVPCSENETAALLDSKNQINIQPQLHVANLRARRAITSPQPPTNLPLPLNSSTPANNATYPPPYNNNNLINGINNHQQNENEGPHAASLLAGGPIPRRRRFENFLKSLVGRKPSKDTSFSPPLLPSPEITITRTPSDQNVILRDPSGLRHPESVSYMPDKIPTTSSTTSLNTAVQQKLWNVVPLLRREGSAASLHHEKSQSIVQYTGMRKCETVLALTRQSSSVCSPVSDTSGTPLGGSRIGGIRDSGGGCSINGIEQIRPLNRLRNSMSTSNATCSRCSSLLSLAVSGSRYSLNTANSGGFINVNNNSNNLNNNFSMLSSSSIVSKTNDCVDGVGGGGGSSNGSSRKSSANDNIPPSNVTTATLNSSPSASSGSSPLSPVIVSSSSAMAVVTLPVELEEFSCKLCLVDVVPRDATTLAQCGCRFCTECMRAYVEFEISEGAYDISCPDAQCPSQGVVALNEIDKLTSQNLMKKHHRYRLNREIELDKFRTWCPRAGCETVCLVGCTSDSALAPSSSNEDKDNAIQQATLCPVQCPSCKDEFCSGCKKPWHPNMSCDENNRRLAADGQDDIGIPFDNDLIKCCPMCAVPIEKDEGCAQMMCKRCKHVFCWYCLASLDDDFLLRHYDKGPCKNKLGHSRASVVWHRAQVIGIFAGFGILLLVASPLLLLAAPCIICCKCRICSGGNKMEEGEGDMEEATALQS